MPGTGEPSDPEEIRVGRLTNPTVHIGLNQLRRVVNRLIETYGPPAEIAIELARELKLTDDDKKRLNRERSEEHTSELQSLMRISYAVFCLNKQTLQLQTHRYKDETVTTNTKHKESTD